MHVLERHKKSTKNLTSPHSFRITSGFCIKKNNKLEKSDFKTSSIRGSAGLAEKNHNIRNMCISCGFWNMFYCKTSMKWRTINL